MSRRPRVALGDVFAVPAGGELVSFVQLVGTKSWADAPDVQDAAKYEMYLAVFERLFRIEDFERWMPENDLLRALFVSAPGWPHERWTVVGKRPVSPVLPFPANRASTPDGEIVVDYTGRKSRPASREEFRRLRSETSATSGLLEELVRVVNGLLPPDTHGLLKDFSIQPDDCLSASLFS